MIHKALPWAMVALVCSCFNPSYPDGLGCDDDGWCPPGLTCNADNLCVSAAGGGADAGDTGPDGLVGMGALVSISIGDDLNLEVGAEHQFTITGTYQDDSQLPINDVTLAIWRSTDNGIASVSFDGIARGQSAGVATITCRYQGLVDAADITVVDPP